MQAYFASRHTILLLCCRRCHFIYPPLFSFILRRRHFHLMNSYLMPLDMPSFFAARSMPWPAHKSFSSFVFMPPPAAIAHGDFSASAAGRGRSFVLPSALIRACHGRGNMLFLGRHTPHAFMAAAERAAATIAFLFIDVSPLLSFSVRAITAYRYGEISRF